MYPHVTHFAINTDDVDATQSFYGAAFGWQFRQYGPPGFVQILDEAGEAPMGAIQQRRQLADSPTVGLECTIAVDDLDLTTERIIAAGGTIVMQRATIPGVGHLIAFTDPGGNPVLAMQYEPGHG